jgi:hypothetical protein
MKRKVAIGALAILASLAAAGNARAEESPRAGMRIAVFPLEGINVNDSVATASTEVLSAALSRQGFEVLDWRAGLAQPQVPPPPPIVPPAPAAPAPVPVPVPPPPAPAQAPPAALATPPLAVPAPAPVPPPAPPPATKGEIAKAAGATGYVDGKLIRLGSKVRVSVSLRDPSGALVDDRQAEARSDDELAIVLERIAMAFAGNKAVEATLSLDRTIGEARRRASKPRLEANFGAATGVLVGLLDSEDTPAPDVTALLAFDARLELGRVLIGLNAGLGLSDDDGNTDTEAVDAHFFVNILAAYYLSNGSLAPFLGAGVGFFVGYRVGSYGDASADSSSDAPPVGFEAFPTFGLEFLRHAPIRLHLDLRYAFDFAGARWGHGPVALLGLDF